MSTRRTVEDWRREVFRSTVLSDRAKVLLLYLADHMRQDRRVSIPRHKIASDLGKTERRITERVTEAQAAGWLDTVVRGQKHVTAVYQGLFPDMAQGAHIPPAENSLSGSSTSPLRNAETRPLRSPNQALRGRTGRPPLEERTCSVGPTDRNVGSEEKTEATLVRFPATGCVWHEHFCPDGCAKAPASREAS